MKNLFFLAAFFLLLNACKETTPSKKGEALKDIKKQINIPKIDTISYELKNISKEKGDCDDTPFKCITAAMERVVINKGLNPTADAKINAFIEKRMMGNAPSIEIGLDSFILEAESFFNEFPDTEVGYSMEAKQQVIYNSPKLLTVKEDLYSYTGGAHGNFGTIFYNFDMEKGQLLSLKDVLKNDFEGTLKAKAEAVFKAKYLEEGATSYSEMGFYFENDQFSMTDNFAFTKEGLKFLYNPYEVAPYALGQQEILLPYSEIKDLIRPDGLLAGL